MEYYVKSVVPMIESNYDNFTNVEKNIADFFIQNRKRVDFSAKAIAERLYVSEASLSRFAKKCGYRGYRGSSTAIWPVIGALRPSARSSSTMASR